MSLFAHCKVCLSSVPTLCSCDLSGFFFVWFFVQEWKTLKKNMKRCCHTDTVWSICVTKIKRYVRNCFPMHYHAFRYLTELQQFRCSLRVWTCTPRTIMSWILNSFNLLFPRCVCIIFPWAFFPGLLNLKTNYWILKDNRKKKKKKTHHKQTYSLKHENM